MQSNKDHSIKGVAKSASWTSFKGEAGASELERRAEVENQTFNRSIGQTKEGTFQNRHRASENVEKGQRIPGEGRGLLLR